MIFPKFTTHTQNTMKKSLFTLLFLSIAFMGFSQFSGTYTVDINSPVTPTNYPSLSTLAQAMSAQGVNGPVTINVVAGSGPYAGQVWFSNIPGASAANPIILNGNGEVFTAVTTTSDRHVIRIEGGNHFTVENMVVNYDPASTGGFYGIHIYRAADSVTVRNCTINMNSNSTLHGGIICSGGLTSILDSGSFHNVLITGNYTESGGYGASCFGKALDLATGVVISNNTFYDWHTNGVYLRESNGVIIENNILDKRDAGINSCNAIQLAQAKNVNGTIRGNRISVAQINNGTMQMRGIYLFNGTGHKVYNNLIHDIALTSGDFTAIEVRTAGTAPEISFNTILMDNANPTNGELFGIAEELGNTNAVLRNNIVSMTQTSSANKSALVIGATSAPATAISSDYNILYAPGGNICTKDALTPTIYTSLSDWQMAGGQDAHSISADPQPVNDIPTNTAVDNKGISFGGVTTDIVGTARPFTPDIGAYEFLTTGIKSIEAKSFAAWPNPANDFYIIDADIAGYTSKLIRADGVQMNATIEDAGNKLKLITSNLANGVYMLTIEMKGERFVQRVVVQH